MNNRRAHVRYDYQQEIEYILQRNNMIFKGITINISDAGLGLYVFNPLQKGQEIIIVKSAHRELNRKGTVRWCNEIGDDVYKAGLMFS